MARLIDADALMKRFYNYYDCVNEFTSKNGYRGDTLMDYEVAYMIDNCIENAPTVDAVPVVHGWWLLERTPDGKPYCFHCSICDDDFSYIGITTAYKYCPHCGAKMDGDGNA